MSNKTSDAEGCKTLGEGMARELLDCCPVEMDRVEGTGELPMAAKLETARVFVIINARSGNSSPEEVCRAVGARHLGQSTGCEVHEAGEGEDILATVNRAIGEGCDLIVAAGGDGTVSAVANAVVGTRARMGIIPLGTTNVLARELGIPLVLDGACDLLAGPNRTARIDVMRLGDRHFVTQIGIGVDALMIRDTTDEHKRRLGVAAYLWTAVRRLIGYRSRRFLISADGEQARPSCLQVVLANCGALGTSGLKWGPEVRMDDGHIDVCIMRGRTLLDYLRVGLSVLLGRHRQDPNIQYLTAKQAVAVSTARPLPVQGDGEVIGETPIEVQVVPRSLQVIVPA
jgi:YegS/Rv2252/BmrU family lipid kinase